MSDPAVVSVTAPRRSQRQKDRADALAASATRDDAAQLDEFIAAKSGEEKEKVQSTARGRPRKRKAPSSEEYTVGEGPVDLDAELLSKPATTAPARKPKRAPAAAAAPAVEKRVPGQPQPGDPPRLRPWRASCPTSVRTRITRARTQRLYLISRLTDGVRCNCRQQSPHHSEFAVLGSTGNVYQVRICTEPQCNCPDFLKGSLCKHILFVLLKVLRIDASSKLLFQPCLLPSELAEIFANAPADPAAQASAPAAVRKAFAKLTGGGEGEQEETAEAEAAEGVTRKPIDGNDCPICYEPLTASEHLEWCTTSCGNNLHKDCLDRWVQSLRARGEKVTCVFCRAEWPQAAAPAVRAAGACENEGYTNLAHLSGQTMYREDYRPWYRGRYW